MKVNWKIRLKNPVWWVQVLVSVATPVLAYMGLAPDSFVTWGMVGDTIVQAVSNPYVVGLMAVSLWNAVIDPTTRGLGDSARALTYTELSK